MVGDFVVWDFSQRNARGGLYSVSLQKIPAPENNTTIDDQIKNGASVWNLFTSIRPKN